MPVNLADLESTIRNAIPVSHLEIVDQSSGCGENYAIVLVSEVGAGVFPAGDLLILISPKSTGVRGKDDLGET